MKVAQMKKIIPLAFVVTLLFFNIGIAASPDKPVTNPFPVPPCLGKPTAGTIAINIVAGEKPATCYIDYHKADDERASPSRKTRMVQLNAWMPAEIVLTGLSPDTRYRYHVFSKGDGDKAFIQVHEGEFRSQRTSASAFSFALFSDAHITPFNPERQQILKDIATSIQTKGPDLALMLGDNIQTFSSHGGPMTEERFGPLLYLHLRHGLDALPATVPIFPVIGNWEGENGWHAEAYRQWARNARRAFIPTPDPSTYPEGGSDFGDYYGFTWGNALFLVLTVTGYTTTDHAMQSPIGRPDDWTLGQEQREWLHRQLKTSSANWKFLFIHHTVGGNAGDDTNSRYGRGGGRGAKTGEQARIHQWMLDYGVEALFYGHDHVFTDIPVDGIHYICVGSAGAPWKFDTSVTGYETYWTPYGYTWVELNDHTAKVNFIGIGTAAPISEQILHTFNLTNSR